MSRLNDISFERILCSDDHVEHHTYDQENKIIPSKSCLLPLKGLAYAVRPRHIVRINWMILAAIISLVAYMFHLKGEVQDLRYDYHQIISQIDEEKKGTNLLKAELAYLNSPARLQALVNQYLKLESVKPQQIVSSNKSGSLGEEKFAELSGKKTATRWRYKRSGAELRTASASSEGFKKLRLYNNKSAKDH